MSADLFKRAEAIRAENKARESHKGTGFHDDDRDPVHPHRFAAPQKNGLPRASDHLVPFYDYDDMEQVHFVGADAEKAMAVLQAWAKRPRGSVATMTGTDRKLCLEIIPRLKVATVDGLPRLTIWLCDWNDVVKALYDEGVGLSGAPLKAE